MARTHAKEEHVTSAVTSRDSRRDVASGVLCESAPRLSVRGLLQFSHCEPLLLQAEEDTALEAVI
jgi:hypothetical protein